MMDQDSTGGTGGNKPKWRERLGTGAKDMPKISDEFKAQPFATGAKSDDATAAKPDGRPPQPVIKLAPMAPRSPGPQAAPDAPSAKEQHPATAPEAQNSDGLAEKLRAQRAAAEMLAVQRVSAARQRAEARIAIDPSAPVPRPPTNEAASKSEAARKNANPPPPKFSFADDGQILKRQDPAPAPAPEKSNGIQRNPGNASPPSIASLVPPRPALGGERPHSPLLRPPASPYRPEQSPLFRPIEPATGYTPPSSRLPPLGGQRPYSQEPGSLPQSSSREIGRKFNEPYRKGQEYGADLRGEDRPGDPRFGRSLPGRTPQVRVPEEDLEDVFEDEAPPPPRRRPGPNEYRSAYREAEEGDTDDRRRSNGPWLLLLALLVAAFATGGVILLYKTKSGAPVASNTSDSVPVVPAPEQPAKTAAEKPADNAAAANRKQIYDRIVGDREVTGDTVVPTEVTPIQPEAAGQDSGIPQGDQGQQGTEDAVPLTLPPASGQDTQGKIDQGNGEQVVAAGSQSGVEEVKTQTTTTQSVDTSASLLPATGTEEETTAAQARPASTANSAAPPAPNTSASSVKPEPQASPAPQKKIAAANAAIKKKKPAAETTASLGEPMVIVPPGEIAAPSQQIVGQSTVPTTDAVPPPAQPTPAPRRKRTLFDLFNRKNETAQNTAVVQPAAPVAPAIQQTKPVETQVASLQPQAAPEKQAGGSGYVVQLASFRSQEEAQAEYTRLRSKYPQVVGSLPSSITQATVAGSTRHRLGLGPVATQDQASKVCSSLIAAGERDCLVRKQ